MTVVHNPTLLQENHPKTLRIFRSMDRQSNKGIVSDDCMTSLVEMINSYLLNDDTKIRYTSSLASQAWRAHCRAALYD